MAEMKNRKGGESAKAGGAKTSGGRARKGGDAAARARHGVQGGAMAAAPRGKNSPRVPSGRGGGEGGRKMTGKTKRVR